MSEQIEITEDMFSVNQIFIKEYPSEAADWCNKYQKIIKEIDKDENGNRQFQIKDFVLNIPASMQVSSQERFDAIEAAISELAVMLTGGEQ